MLMDKNRALYDFFMEHAEKLTETWYESIEDDDPESIYRSTDSSIIAELKRQNQIITSILYVLLLKTRHIYILSLKSGLKT